MTRVGSGRCWAWRITVAVCCRDVGVGPLRSRREGTIGVGDPVPEGYPRPPPHCTQPPTVHELTRCSVRLAGVEFNLAVEPDDFGDHLRQLENSDVLTR